MSSLTVRGAVLLEGGAFPIAGVTVVALMDGDAAPQARSSYQSVRMQLGRVVTDSDGSFAIETDDQDPVISRWACVLRNCDEFKFQLACVDLDDAPLHETEPLTYIADQSVTIELPEPNFTANPED
jgi:hypothetical protein